MNRTYISDIITKEEIEKWKPGNRILLNSQTGSGKSHFVKNVLYNYCLNNNKKVLLLSNRSILKAQNIEDLDVKTNIIHPENYQLLESRILFGKTVEELFKDFDFIVYDEAHYLFSDSQFNKNTDLLLKPLFETPKDKILIFSTATPEAILYCQPDFAYTYNIPFDYSYIENIYFYDKEATLDRILLGIPDNEKIIYFSGDALEALELSERNDNAAFICSESNKVFSKKISRSAVNNIINQNTFYTKLLCTTKVLDNGINLIDKNIKHIIINTLDPITFTQMIGRKRVVDANDKINLYVKNFHGGQIYPQIKRLEDNLNMATDLKNIGIEAFKKKYESKKIEEFASNDFMISDSKIIGYEVTKKFYGIMFHDKDKMGYKKMVCKMLHQDISKIKNAELEFEKSKLVDIMEVNMEVKLFDDDIEIFRNNFFENVFAGKKVDYRKRGSICANAILIEDKLPYQIITTQETKGKNRKKRYWMVARRFLET